MVIYKETAKRSERVFVKILFDERNVPSKFFLNDFRQIKLEYGINNKLVDIYQKFNTKIVHNLL